MKVFQNSENLPVLLIELPSELRAKVVSGKHSIFTSLPERPELRYLLEDENYEGFLQTAHRYSRAQSGKFGDFNNCRSQSSQ